MTWSSRWIDSFRRRVERIRRTAAYRRREAYAPMPRWKVHGLRHTLATHLREDLGVSRDVVQLILMHTQGVRQPVGAAPAQR
jgi:integrase